MSDKDKEQKKKYTEKPWALPKFIADKAIKDNLSFKAVAVYKWIYDHNNHAKYLDDDPNALFTKGSLDSLYAAIRRDIDVSVRDICMELRGKGWIEPIKNAPLFKGRRQSGFICRLAKEERLLAKAIQQEMEKEEELPENTKVMESLHDDKGAEWPGPGVYNQFGTWLYNDANGEAVILPKDGDFPARPSEDAEWWEPEGRWVTLEEYRQLYKEQNKN